MLVVDPIDGTRPALAGLESCCASVAAYVEPGPRMVADVSGMRAELERVGGGAVLNNSPYDLAAPALILEEAGAIVTDAYGHTLGPRPLLGSSVEYQLSVLAGANAGLHRGILDQVEAGIGRLLG